MSDFKIGDIVTNVMVSGRVAKIVDIDMRDRHKVKTVKLNELNIRFGHGEDWTAPNMRYADNEEVLKWESESSRLETSSN